MAADHVGQQAGFRPPPQPTSCPASKGEPVTAYEKQPPSRPPADQTTPVPYPQGDIDLVRLNQIIRHRVRNVCGGCRMILDVLRTHFTETGGGGIEWDALYAEVDNIQQFSQRLDLLIAPLPPPQPMLLTEVLAVAREGFAERFPFCSLELNGPDEPCELPAGNWLAIALEELLANAGRAAGPSGDGTVELAWTLTPDIQFVVANNGTPFAAEIPVHPPIPFRSTAPSYDGLGLTIVQRLCLALGMELTVRTDLPGVTAIMLTRAIAEKETDEATLRTSG